MLAYNKSIIYFWKFKNIGLELNASCNKEILLSKNRN